MARSHYRFLLSSRQLTLIKQACRPQRSYRDLRCIYFTGLRDLWRGGPPPSFPHIIHRRRVDRPDVRRLGRRRTTKLYWRRPFFPIKIARGAVDRGFGSHLLLFLWATFQTTRVSETYLPPDIARGGPTNSTLDGEIVGHERTIDVTSFVVRSFRTRI